MSLRRQLKVPQYGLFYFDSDRTISVVPTKSIKKVLSGNNTSQGSVVELDYAGVLLKAEIIAVHGKYYLFLQEYCYLLLFVNSLFSILIMTPSLISR